MLANLPKVIFVFVSFAKLNCGAEDICSSPPPRVKPHECCDFPMFFEKSTFDDCGVQSPIQNHHEPPSCDTLMCVFKKENMIGEDQKINKEMAKAYINKWSVSHPEWVDTNGEIAEKCLSDANLQSGPPHMCQPMKVIHCFSKMLLLVCPANYWKSSDQCENVKAYFKQCQPR